LACPVEWPNGRVRRPRPSDFSISKNASRELISSSRQHPSSRDLQLQIASYVADLKAVGVMKPSVDPAKFASRVCVDVFA